MLSRKEIGKSLWHAIMVNRLTPPTHSWLCSLVAKKSRKTPARRKKPAKGRLYALRHPILWIRRWLFRGILALAALAAVLVILFAFVAPPTTPYMLAEAYRLEGLKKQWVDLENLPPHVPASAVAAEDANFCLHWGFDMSAIRDAVASGARRGGSTISQQTAKNVFLWQGRSWFRKLLEAGLTPAIELVWSKHRIVEVYLNVAEFDEGVFGIEAAAQHYFGIPAAKLSTTQAARLAAVLPNPKGRSATKPTQFVQGRARAIRNGAETIRADGRADCFLG